MGPSLVNCHQEQKKDVSPPPPCLTQSSCPASGIARAWTRAYFGEGSGPVLLDEVRCTGNELAIEECPKRPWGEHNCGHGEDAGVSCTPLTGRLPRPRSVWAAPSFVSM